jgi:hypothetical protein
MSTSSTVRSIFGNRRRRRRLAPVGIAGIAAALVTLPLPARAAPPPPALTQAVCHVDVPQVTVSPGFSATPAKGTGTSGAGATIRCFGTVQGASVVGDPGALSVTFTYGTGALSSLTGGDTCLAGSGDGTVSALIPTIKGPLVLLQGPIHFGFLGPVATFYGHFGDVVFAGIGEPLPDLGTPFDCLGKPLTRFSIRGQFGMKDLPGGGGLPLL